MITQIVHPIGPEAIPPAATAHIDIRDIKIHVQDRELYERRDMPTASGQARRVKNDAASKMNFVLARAFRKK
jgi:hypothetical protein